MQEALAAKRAWLLQQGWSHTVLAPGAQGEGQLDCGGLPWPRPDGYRLLPGRRRARQLIEDARPDIEEAADPGALLREMMA